MKRRLCALTALALLVMAPMVSADAAPARMQASPDTLLRDIELESVPAGLALRSIARLYALNLSVEEGLEVPITLHLEEVSAPDLFAHLAGLYPLEITLREGIWHAAARDRSGGPALLRVGWQAGRLEVEARSARLDSVAAELSRRGVLNLLAGPLGERRLTGYLVSSEPEAALRALLRAHGLTMKREGTGVYLVQEPAGQSEPVFELFASGGLLTFNLVGAPLRPVLEEFARSLEWDVFFYGEAEGAVTARATGMPAATALDLLLVGTGLGVRLEGTSLLIGNATQPEFGEVRLLRLEHIRSEGLLDRIPESLKQGVELQILPEQNGIVVTGPTPAINAIESFVDAIDHSAPQILFEALVVDFFDESSRELGLELGVGPPRDSTFAQAFSPEVDVEARGGWLKGGLTIGEKFMNLPVVGQLPDDFYLRLKALETAGKVRIRSRPQLATLNGSPATLTVGATQYYLIRTETTFAQQTVSTRISEKFETIEANMLLQLTPWVTTSGEILTKIRPEFNTPQGSLNAQVPPTINHRILETTVSLRDGQTIILGGLVQETEQATERRFPLLWRIPLLGRLFVSKGTSVSTSELMIYLTPHIYRGEDQRPPEGGGL